MNYRSMRIIELLRDGTPRTVCDIAAKLSVSERLVRYDIEKANEFLGKNGFPAVQTKRRDGVSLALSEEQQSALPELLGVVDVNDCYPQPWQRMEYILMVLLDSSEYLTCQYFVERLLVSKSSIDKDLAAIRTALPEGLTLEGKTGKGIRLCGDEQLKSNTAFGLVAKNLRMEKHLLGFYEQETYMDKAIAALFPPAFVPAIARAVAAMEAQNNRKLSHGAHKELMVYLGVLLGRVQKGRHVEMDEAELKLLRAAPDYLTAVKLGTTLEKYLDVCLGPGEIGLITTLLLGLPSVSQEDAPKENWVQVQVVSDYLVKEMEKRLSLSFSQDKELYHALQQHLGPNLVRLKNRIPVTNPNLEQIRNAYPALFEALSDAVGKSSHEIFKGMSAEEIGYITLHFCASEERLRRKCPRCNIVIICTHGIGTGYLIKEMLCARFSGIRVLEVATRTDAEKKFANTVDLIVSSVPIKHVSIPVVEINAIPTGEDLSRLAAAIDAARQKNGSQWAESCAVGFFREIVAIIQNTCGADSASELIPALLDTFQAHHMPVYLEHVQPSLADLLSEETIATGVRAAGWEEAVRAAGSLITATGAADATFIESMLETVEQVGPYIVIAPGVALPHGKPGVGISRLTMSLITLNPPVPFFHQKNDPVSLVLCLAPKDDYSHLKALSDFLALGQMGKFQQLTEASSANQILHLLRK